GGGAHADDRKRRLRRGAWGGRAGRASRAGAALFALRASRRPRLTALHESGKVVSHPAKGEGGLTGLVYTSRGVTVTGGRREQLGSRTRRPGHEALGARSKLSHGPTAQAGPCPGRQ